jgi:L-asparaginase
MHFPSLLYASLAAAVSFAAPSPSLLNPRQANVTASQRLGLKWLGGNSTLPKILYVFLDDNIPSTPN